MDQRLLALTDSPSGCKLWTGPTHRNGYGQCRESYGTRSTHRAAYIHFVGPIPDGMCVLHKCDTPLCCNPEHLALGTLRDNSRDMHQKGRARNGDRTKCTGSLMHLSKLKESDIPVIHRLFQWGISQTQIARDYGVSQPCISAIILGKTWKGCAIG